MVETKIKATAFSIYFGTTLTKLFYAHCSYTHVSNNLTQIATSTRLLSIKYEFYGFSDYLIETIN